MLARVCNRSRNMVIAMPRRRRKNSLRMIHDDDSPKPTTEKENLFCRLDNEPKRIMCGEAEPSEMNRRRKLGCVLIQLCTMLWFFLFLQPFASYVLTSFTGKSPSVSNPRLQMHAKTKLQYRRSQTVLNFQVMVVNMPNRTTKFYQTVGHLSKSHHFPVQKIERMEGVVGKHLNLDAYFAEGKLDPAAYRSILSTRRVGGVYLTPGGLGCLLSHVQIWKHVTERNRPMVVFEDDVYLSHGFDSYLDQILMDLPTDFGLFYFADLVQSKATRDAAFPLENKPTLNRIRGEQWGTYAYMISPKAAKLLYDHAFPMHYQADSYIMDVVFAHDIPVYRARTNLVGTDNVADRVSDVQLSNVVLNESIPHTVLTSRYLPGFETYTPRQVRESFTVHELVVEMDDAYASSSSMFQFQLDLLYKYGGLFIRKDTRLVHPLHFMLQSVPGFIGYAVASNGKINYPILGMRSRDSLVQALIQELENVTDTDEMHARVIKMTSWIPDPDRILLFPISVLYDTGY